MTRKGDTFASLVRRGAGSLQRASLTHGHGYASARDEAEVLTRHALSLTLDEAAPEAAISAQDAERARLLIATRIASRKPAAYLTREAWLAGVRFYVDERVIVPRSYIAELMAEQPWLLPPPNKVHHALDLCTGSGCLAILLARQYRKALIDATDISQDALNVAAINVRRHRFKSRVKLLISNVFSRLNQARYDLIISNPPYVRHSVMRKLPAEYRHEPALALASGDDGFDCLRQILRHAARHLNPEGLLIVECGHARSRVEEVWPNLPFLWADTSGGDDCVFVLRREDLLSTDNKALPRKRKDHSENSKTKTSIKKV